MLLQQTGDNQRSKIIVRGEKEKAIRSVFYDYDLMTLIHKKQQNSKIQLIQPK